MLAWSLMAACQSLLSTNGNDYKGLTMTTQSSKDGAMPSDGTHWEIHSRSLLCDGLPRELPTSKRPGSNRDVFAMAEINNLYIAMVHTLAWYQRNEMEPGAERLVADTRHCRPRLLEDIRAVWMRILGDDVFPWHDDYIVYAWAKLRRLNNPQKVECCQWLGVEVPAQWIPGSKEAT